MFTRVIPWLWALMMHFQAPRMLPQQDLDHEVDRWKERRRIQILSGNGTFTFHGGTLAPGVVTASEAGEAGEVGEAGEAGDEVGRCRLTLSNTS